MKDKKEKEHYMPILDARGRVSWEKGHIPTSSELPFREMMH